MQAVPHGKHNALPELSLTLSCKIVNFWREIVISLREVVPSITAVITWVMDTLKVKLRVFGGLHCTFWGRAVWVFWATNLVLDNNEHKFSHICAYLQIKIINGSFVDKSIFIFTESCSTRPNYSDWLCQSFPLNPCCVPAESYHLNEVTQPRNILCFTIYCYVKMELASPFMCLGKWKKRGALFSRHHLGHVSYKINLDQNL